jgi:hypothetical protein
MALNPSSRPPRPCRNNNPGNIRRTAIPWLGLAELPEMDAYQRAEQEFCVFKSPAYGFRALAVDLLTSFERGRTSVAQIVSRFAPPAENDTASYIDAVAHALKVEPSAVLDLANADTLKAFCRAIAVHEAGGWFFDDADLDKGVAMSIKPKAAVA